MESSESTAIRDAGIISAAQKVKHYEITTYGTLHQFAQTLGLLKVEIVLKTKSKAEKAAGKKL
jgi:ferritin-like metal-binding protein YciE